MRFPLIQKLTYAVLLLLTVASLAFPGISSAQSTPPTIVISDIDDTIQNTNLRNASRTLSEHIVHYWDFVTGLFKSHDAFVAMPALYMAMASNGRGIHYVSGAPRLIARIPQKFLQTSGFPSGELSGRPSLDISTEEFKVARISEIILANPGTRFILIGDNGERDVVVYQRLKADPRFSNQIAATYIHRLYPDGVGLPLAEGQRPYLTAADLAVQLLDSGDISKSQAAEVLKLVDIGLTSEYRGVRERAFPTYASLDPQDIDALEIWGEAVQEPELKGTLFSIVGKLRERAKKQPRFGCPKAVLAAP